MFEGKKNKGAPKAAEDKKAKSKSEAKRKAVMKAPAKRVCPECGHLRKVNDFDPGKKLCKGCEAQA